MRPAISGLFVREGTSDEPLADVVEQLFALNGVTLRLSAPDLSRLPIENASTVEAKLRVGLDLAEGNVDLLVVHRDADNAGRDQRVEEIQQAVRALDLETPTLPLIPIRMTEAWLLLDEPAIRRTAGNPNGRADLGLPGMKEVERVADPKAVLRDALLSAAEARGRRRREAERRFHAHRRRLISELDVDGPIRKLESFKALVASVATECARVG